MKTQIRQRGGIAPPGAWGKWAPKKNKKNKNGAAGAGENWGPLKSANDLEGVNFFFEIDPDQGVPYAYGRVGSLTRNGGSLTRKGWGVHYA